MRSTQRPVSFAVQAHNPGERDRWFKSSPCTHEARTVIGSGFSIFGEMDYRVYVIQNPQGRFYIGLSENVEQRLCNHNNGVSTWTKYRGPWALRWTSGPMPLSDARKLELALKRYKGGNGFYAATGITRASGSLSC